MIDLGAAEVENFVSLYNDTIIIKEKVWPSDWYERKKILMSSTAAIPGYVSYYNTPYWKEPVNCISPDHPAKDITIIGPAQDGKTFMVLEPMIGYTIECNPGNILHLTGNSDLSPDAALRVDTMIQNCKLGYLIKPQYVKLKNNRTGDTAIRKEYPMGIYRVNSITKKNALRQNDIMVLILDDADAAKRVDPKVGNLWDTAKGRTKAFEDKCKRVCTSSPEIKGHSLIEEVFSRSDQRSYYIPCPCPGCNEFIELQFQIQIDDKNTAGLTWKLDNMGRVDPKSVGYICQKCAGFFTEKNKLLWLNDGKWIPQCEPKELYHYGYKKSGLYSSPGMTSWFTLASESHKCNPPGEPRIESQYQTFKNIMLGELYEPPTEQPQASDLMKRCRDYKIGIVPESVSESDGNGDILLLYATFDCNGTLNDARIDYEVRAKSRKGATYSVKYGSLGTFIARQSAEQKAMTVREKYTYKIDAPNSVFKLVDQLLDAVFEVDTGRKMKIGVSGMDCGYLDEHIFNYLDRNPRTYPTTSSYGIFGLMGDKDQGVVIHKENLPKFKVASSRPNLYLVNVNEIKDDIANRMKLPWKKGEDGSQPHEFMNFPQYDYNGFFRHYESEERKENDKGYFGWQKKSPVHDNHLWDCGVYGYAVIDILLFNFLKKGQKQANWTWADYAALCPVYKDGKLAAK